MSRHESDREDLMREATALRRRVELKIPDQVDTVVAGFRSDGSLSIYFGSDPVYHFDAGGGLRRGFVDGCVIRTQGTTLARMTRARTENQTELLRHDMTDDELNRFKRQMLARLDRLSHSIVQKHVTTIREVPEESNVADELLAALQKNLRTESWLAPRIPGKR